MHHRIAILGSTGSIGRATLEVIDHLGDEVRVSGLVAGSNVERLADQVLMMKAGRIVDAGAPQALIERYGRHSLEEVFLDIARGRDRDAEAAA